MCQTILDACEAYLPALGPEARTAAAEAECHVAPEAVAWALVEAVHARADPMVSVDDDVVALVQTLAPLRSYAALLKAWVHTFRGRAGMPAVSDETIDLVVSTRSGGISTADGFRTMANFFRTRQIAVERVHPVMRKSTPPPVVGSTLLQQFQ